MGYIERNLVPQEQILQKHKISTVYVVIPFIMAVVFLLLGFCVLFKIPIFGYQINSPEIAGFTIVFCVFYSLRLIYEGIKRLGLKLTCECVVTNQRVFLKWGLLHRNLVEVYLDKIESIGIDQDILERMINCGRIHIRGTGGSAAPCPGVCRPYDFRKTVNEIIQQLKMHQ